MKKQYLEGAKIRGAHGVRGLFRTEVYCDRPEVLAAQKRVYTLEKDGTYREHIVTSATVAGDTVILGIDGIPDREAAQAARGTLLYLARADIPVAPGAILLADLVDLPVTDADTGRVYGRVKDVNDTPAGRMFTVATEKGDALLPDVPAFVKKIDTEGGILVTPIPGLLDD